MWRHVVQARGASTSRCCAQQSKRLGAITVPSQLLCSSFPVAENNVSVRSLSSAQPSSWDDASPFTMSSAPSLSQIQNPTAERIVMKTFLNTLQVTSAVCSDTVETDYQSEETIVETVVEESSQVSEEWALQVIKEETTSVVAVSSVVNVPIEEAEPQQDLSESHATSDAKESEPVLQKDFHGDLLYAIRINHPVKARLAFRECLQNNVTMKQHLLEKLFNLVMPHDPITGLAALIQIRKVRGKPATSAMYCSLCESVGKVNWKVARTGQYTKMCSDLREELAELDPETYQKRLFPVLLVSLVQQPMHRIGLMAKGLYNYMEKNDFPLSTGKLCHLISVSRYTRQDDLSFPTILSRLVNEGKCPVV